jgi:uncharacterized protein (DUF1697 family)
MNQYIAFLGGINLGKRRIKMERLRELFEASGFSDVSTFIASGNVIFASGAGDATKVEQRIERHLRNALGYEVVTFVRTRAEVAAIATTQPFSKAEMANPGCTILAGLFKTALAPDLARQLTAIRTDVDEFRVIGREYFWLCRIKMSDSKVWTLPEMRVLKLPVTSMRNRTTLRKLAELYPPSGKAKTAS